MLSFGLHQSFICFFFYLWNTYEAVDDTVADYTRELMDVIIQVAPEFHTLLFCLWNTDEAVDDIITDSTREFFWHQYLSDNCFFPISSDRSIMVNLHYCH